MIWFFLILFVIATIFFWSKSCINADNLQRKEHEFYASQGELARTRAELQRLTVQTDAIKNEIKPLTKQLSEETEKSKELSSQVKTLLELLKAEKEKKQNLIQTLTNGNFDSNEPFFSTETTLSDYVLSNYTSVTSAIPFMAKLSAEFLTLDLKKLHDSLDWGASKERAKKVTSLRQIRRETKNFLEQYKTYEYQLLYLLDLFPQLNDVLDSNYSDLPSALQISDVEHDSTRDFLTESEYHSLSETERNQLALDRYVSSHRKSNWQIGRDYENYIGYEFESKGFDVNYNGSLMGKEDLGRDLIAQKNKRVYVVQCKYWSNTKTIHEKHIAQLYGTVVTYCIEHNLSLKKDVIGVFVTNIDYSEMAKKFAEMLGIKIYHSVALGSYPMIKCNVGRDEYGRCTQIYHLPFDQQYDSIRIEKEKGERFAFTVQEAESLGFRRAFKWHGE